MLRVFFIWNASYSDQTFEKVESLKIYLKKNEWTINLEVYEKEIGKSIRK